MNVPQDILFPQESSIETDEMFARLATNPVTLALEKSNFNASLVTVVML